MAIAPFDRIFIPRLRQVQRQRAYTRYVVQRWAAQLPGRLLPMLATLPLPVQERTNAADSTTTTLSAALLRCPRLHLVGALGSGRSLAVQQMVLAWANGNAAIPGTFPVVLHVPTAPLSPDLALSAALKEAGIEQSTLVLERGLAAGQWLLVLDDWDRVDGAKQAVWRQWLLDLTARYPVLPALVLSDDDGVAWPEFATWMMAPVGAELLTQWLAMLLPAEETTLVLGPLLNDHHVRSVGERVADVATLALTYPNHGFPSNRAQLYSTALDKILRPLVGSDLSRVRTALAALGYTWVMHGTASVPPAIVRPILPELVGFVQLDDVGRVQFKQPLFALFCAALHVAATQNWHQLDPHSPLWQALMPLVTGLLADPEAAYSAIRGAGRPNTARTLLLGACLYEHHVPLPGWSTAILGSLAALAKAEPAHAPAIWALLERMPSVVGATVAEQLMSGAAGERWALTFLRMLPPAMTTSYLLEMVGDSRLLRSTRRVAALHLQQTDEQTLIAPLVRLAERPLDDTGRILTTHLLACSGGSGRRIIVHLNQAGRIIFPQSDDASDARAIVAAATALLGDEHLDMATHTAASVALNGCVTETTAPILLYACTSASASLREAARRALLSGDSGLALRALGRLILGDDVHWAARYEALQALIQLQSTGASVLLVRVLRSDIPLAARIEATRALAQRDGEIVERVAGVLADPTVSPSLRAAIAYLGSASRPSALTSILLQLCCTEAPAPLRARVVRSMHSCPADEVLALLGGIVEHERTDLETLSAAIGALGEVGDESGIWALRTILIGPLAEQLRAGWQTVLDPESLDSSPLSWPVEALPAAYHWRWGVALATGATAADPPTSIQELVAREVQALRTEAATALQAIGGTAARQVLREALTAQSPTDGFAPTSAIASQLAHFDGGLDLAETLKSSVAPAIRWVAAHALHSSNGHTSRLRDSLTLNAVADPQTRSAMLLALGNDPQIIPMLETMIVDDHAPLHLRVDAVRTLGQMELPHVEGLLLALLSSVRDEPSLQVAALNILHAPMAAATLGAVRTILRDPRPAIEVAAAALRCLVRANDGESLPLFLRYAQHDSPTLALPAIDGLTLLHDNTSTALLTRLAHTSGKSTRIRLHASGALLHLEGNTHLALVRQMVESGSISTRLLALDILLAALPDPTALLEYGAPSVPTPLRVRLATALAAHGSPGALNELAALLEQPHESVTLRCLAAETLCAVRYSAVLPLIEATARDPHAPISLRYRTIHGLRHWRTEPTTLLALSALAEDTAPYIRSWALQALLD